MKHKDKVKSKFFSEVHKKNSGENDSENSSSLLYC